jgi:hypothetical protein
MYIHNFVEVQNADRQNVEVQNVDFITTFSNLALPNLTQPDLIKNRGTCKVCMTSENLVCLRNAVLPVLPVLPVLVISY